MYKLPFDQQVQKIGQLATTRQIEQNDRYLQVYPELLQSIQALLPLDRPKLLLTAHAVFGWMPTQLRVHTGQLDAALNILKTILEIGADASVTDLALLASTFQTTGGNSVVAASKILHFLAPQRFPIWDRLVAKAWGLPPSGPRAPTNYFGFTHACRQFALDANGQQACQFLRQELARAGYNNSMTGLRLIELMLFLRS
jgi:hypothetical protein